MQMQNESTKRSKTAAKWRRIIEVSFLRGIFISFSQPVRWRGGGLGGYAPERERVTSTEALILNCTTSTNLPFLDDPFTRYSSPFCS